MIHFSQSGNTIWSVPNDYPQIATADGGVIGSSGITYDSQGRADGQIANMPIYAWTGDAYQGGSVNQAGRYAGCSSHATVLELSGSHSIVQCPSQPSIVYAS